MRSRSTSARNSQVDGAAVLLPDISSRIRTRELPYIDLSGVLVSTTLASPDRLGCARAWRDRSLQTARRIGARDA